MKTIIAGSRTILDRRKVFEILDSYDWVTEVISGCAKGVDTIGEEWAKKKGLPIARFPADWLKHGKKAGYLRNLEMADNAEACIVIHRNSKGSLHMLDIARKKRLRVIEVLYL